MNLKNSSRPARLFHWTLDAMDDFTDHTYRSDRYRERTNLCHFVRVIAVYLPVIVISHLMLLGAIVFTFIAWPIFLFGFGVWISATSVIALVVGFAYGVDRYRYYRRTHGVAPVAPEAAQETETVPPGFWAIFVAWLKAKKEKVCPPVRFIQKEVPDA